MSGGYFNGDQYSISNIIELIEKELNSQGKLRPKEDLWNCQEYYNTYPEEKYYPTYSKAIQNKLIEAIKALKIAQIYAHRIDWFLSDDDGEESFISRLNEELTKLNENGRSVKM